MTFNTIGEKILTKISKIYSMQPSQTLFNLNNLFYSDQLPNVTSDC